MEDILRSLWILLPLFGFSLAFHLNHATRGAKVPFGGGDSENSLKRSLSSVFGVDLSRRNTRVSFRECSLPEGQRLDCGAYGINEESCYSRECCWSESQQAGVPWCFHSIPTMKPGCLMNNDERLECGWYGIRKEQCLAKGCCWQPSSDPGAPWCYHTTRVPVYEGECGIPAFQPNVMSRIVGGVEAIPHSWPWMVSLQVDRQHVCGGSLINNQWVVSAAHCEPAFRWSNRDPEVVIGMHSQSSPGETARRIVISDVISHERYSGSRYDHDIMLLKLAEPVEFSDAISPVCLPPPGAEFHEGTRCYTTGWGNLQQFGSSPDALQQVMVPLISTEDCNQPGWYGGRVDETMMCAGYQEGGRDSCQGDSGGPLVCYGEDSWVLAGIVSWGEGCASENKPGIYSRVTNLQTWLETKISENS